MRKRSLPPIPPLSLKTLQRVESIDSVVRAGLRDCGSGSSFNVEKVLRLLRSCIVESLDAQIKYYVTLETYKPEWITQIAEKTWRSMLWLVTGADDDDWEYLQDGVWRTVTDHLEAKARANELEMKSVMPAKKVSRVDLRDAYFSKFKDRDIKVLDVCWAAGQHYSEWKRWLRNAVKDNSAPNRAFRALLTSGKHPAEYRKQSRPRGWK